MSKITCFALPRAGGVDAIAVDEDGKFLTSMICSSKEWAMEDLGADSVICKFHGWFYKQRYGDDFTLEWSEEPPANWDGQREHTDATLRPWHLDPVNGSKLFREETKPDPHDKVRRLVMGESTARPDRFRKGERVEP